MAKGLAVRLLKADAELLARSEYASVLDNMSEMFRHGNKGAISDARAFVRPWRFKPEDIRIEVNLWYGETDRNVSLQMGEYYQSSIPQNISYFYPGEDRFIFYSHAEEILEQLVSGTCNG